MIRVIDGKEVLIICVNEGCSYWDDKYPFFCNQYTSSNEVIDCNQVLFRHTVVKPIKP